MGGDQGGDFGGDFGGDLGGDQGGDSGGDLGGDLGGDSGCDLVGDLGCDWGRNSNGHGEPMTPIETLSSLALDVYRYGLTESCQPSPAIIERLEAETGGVYEPQAVSRSLRELESAGWCKRLMFGFRKVAEPKENQVLPI